jgi:hypothetical protein
LTLKLPSNWLCQLPMKDCGLRMTKKEEKANGGCLGVKSRRRTWYTAKSVGEPCAGANPAMSEWGNPAVKRQSPTAEHIGGEGGTGGTETS